MTRQRMVPPEVVECIAEGRAPRIEELYRVADHIRLEIGGGPSAFAWGNSGPSPDERCLRAAQAALIGSD